MQGGRRRDEGEEAIGGDDVRSAGGAGDEPGEGAVVAALVFAGETSPMSAMRSVAASVTVQPPKPPPVMRAPYTPPAAPISCASSTSVSSSGALTS